jgi:chromosome segregation ATPase
MKGIIVGKLTFLENKPSNFSGKENRYLLPSSNRTSKPLAVLEPKSTQEAYFRHKQNMEEDKVGLLKRLNSVMMQLDQAKSEKLDIEMKLEENVQKVLILESQLSKTQSNSEKVDSNMQSTLNAERAINSQLNRDIKKYEHERDMLRDKLKEQEAFRLQLDSDASKLTNEYHQKSIELKKLESDFVDKQTLLTKLEREHESLKNYERYSKEEKSKLEEEIEKLTIEKKRLIGKTKHKI